MKKILAIILFLLFAGTSFAQIERVDAYPSVYDLDGSFSITIKVNDPLIDSIVMDRPSQLDYQQSSFTSLTLYDDGSHGDTLANDSVFTCNELSLSYVSVIGIRNVRAQNYNSLMLHIYYQGGSSSSLNTQVKLGVRGIRLSEVPTPSVISISDSIQMTDHVLNLVVAPTSTYPNYIIDKREAAKKYYELFEDDRDFLLFSTTFPTVNIGSANYFPVMNHIENIGLADFDHSTEYGSDGVLQGRLDFNLGYGGQFGLLNHELMHRWGNYLPSSLGLEANGGHWQVMESEPSIFSTSRSGHTIQHDSSNVYSLLTDSIYQSKKGKYNDLERYLMGLIPLDSVHFPIRTLENPSLYSWPVVGHPYIRYTSTGFRDISLEEFVLEAGDRNPATGPTDFNVGSIVLSERLLTPEELAYYQFWMVETEKPTTDPELASYAGLNFQGATDGKGQLHSGLSLIPVISGIHERKDYCYDSAIDSIPVSLVDEDINALSAVITSNNESLIPNSSISMELKEETYLIYSLTPGVSGEATITIRITDRDNNTREKNVLIESHAELEAVFVTENVSCSGSEDGAVGVSGANGGVSPYLFDWVDPTFTGSNNTDLAPGWYSIIVTDSIDCSVTDSVELTSPTPLDVTGSVTDETNGDDGAIDISVSGGTSPYTYLWDDQGESITEDIFNLEADSYQIIVQDINECSDTASFEVKPMITAVINDELLDKIEVHPNPSNGTFYVISSPEIAHNKAELQVLDITGKIVYQKSIVLDQKRVRVDSRLRPGQYFLKITIKGEGLTYQINII